MDARRDTDLAHALVARAVVSEQAIADVQAIQARQSERNPVTELLVARRALRLGPTILTAKVHLELNAIRHRAGPYR